MRYILILLGVVALAAFDWWVIKQSKPVPPQNDIPMPWGKTDVVTRTTVSSLQKSLSGPPKSSYKGKRDDGSSTNAMRKASEPVAAAPRDAIDGEYIFGFHDRADRDSMIRAAEVLGWKVVRHMDFANAVLIRRGPESSSLEDLLAASPTPVEQSPNFYIRIPPMPAEPTAGLASRPGFGSGVLEWLGVSADNHEWGSGVTVAILDTPIGDHVALEGASITGEGLVSASEDQLLHGTAVASLIASNGRGIRGLAPGVTLISLPVLDESGRGDLFRLAEGLIKAVQAGARVVNMSVGTHGDGWLLRRAVEYAAQNGVALVAAAGNDGAEGPLYPAAYPSVVAVGAADAAGLRLPFSNRGRELAFLAPGWRILAAGSRDRLVEMSGTSAGAALTSGALAAVLSRSPEITTVEAVRILERYCDDTGRMGWDEETGAGVINVGRAINRDLAGIYDVAVSTPFLWPRRTPEDDVVVTLYAQNRGTEKIRHLMLNVVIGPRRQTLDFYDVEVGASVGRDFRIAIAEASREGGVPIVVEAVIEGEIDIQPADNILKTAVKLSAESSKEK